MSNIILGHSNKVDKGTLSGGSWLPTLPLTHLQNRKLGRVARSTDLNLASTQFTFNAGRSIRSAIVALVNHNLTLNAKYRITASDVANFANVILDTGWVDVWPAVFVYQQEGIEWEDDNWWNAQFTLADIEGFTNTLIATIPSVYAQYWKIEIDDATSNADGYVQLGRFFIGDTWSPRINASYGLAIGNETNTRVDQSLSGAESFDVKKPYRVTTFSTDWLSDDEAFSGAFDIERKHGIHGEVIYIHDLNDTVHAVRRRFYGRLRKLSPIEFPSFDLRKKGWEVKEIV